MHNNNVFIMAPRPYNKMPKTLLEIELLKTFKSKIKEFLIHRSYYTIKEYLDDKFDM